MVSLYPSLGFHKTHCVTFIKESFVFVSSRMERIPLNTRGTLGNHIPRPERCKCQDQCSGMGVVRSAEKPLIPTEHTSSNHK